MFKVYQRFRLDTLLPKLAQPRMAAGWKLRSIRGEVRRMTPTNLAAHSDLDRFLLDSHPVVKLPRRE